jgi:hypothetical protein
VWKRNRIKATRLPICYRNHHLRRPDIDTTDMDDIRKSLSKLKKDFKHRLGGKKRGEERPGASAAGERASSPARFCHQVLVSKRAGPVQTYRKPIRGIPLLIRSPVTADEGRLDDPQRKEVDVGKKEASRSRAPGSGRWRSCRKWTQSRNQTGLFPSIRYPDRAQTRTRQYVDAFSLAAVSDHPYRQRRKREEIELEVHRLRHC